MSTLSKNWECAFPGCGKRFSRKEHLNRHNLIHNPEYQYKCHICGRRYARSDVFKRHVKQHNPIVAQPPDTRRVCLPCGERNVQCDGNSPCGACVSTWTECRWIGSDNRHQTGVEQATVILPNGHTPAAWLPSVPDTWASSSILGTPSQTSVLNDLHSSPRVQAVTDSTGYVRPSSGSNAATTEPIQQVTPSNSMTSQTVSVSSQQQLTGSPGSTGVRDLDNSFDKDSPATKRLLELFFSEIHPYWAILHEPTFEVEETQPILLAAMVMLASWLEDGPEHQVLAPVIFEEVTRIRMDLHPSLNTLQAILLYVIYATCTLTVEGMVPRALNLIGLLISTCRYLGIFNGQYTCIEMNERNCTCPFVTWRVQEQLNRLAFSVLRVDAYLSVLLDHPPSVRYQELCIPLPKSCALWRASTEEERRALQWNEPAGREKALFSFFMRDALDPTRKGKLPYCLTDVDYHLSTCATQADLWEAAREAHSSMSDELVRETDPGTFLQLAHPHLTLWRSKQKEEDCVLREAYFAGAHTGSEHLLGPHTFTLMYVSTLKLQAPLNMLRAKGHYYKSRPGATIPTRKPRAHLRTWIASGCPRSALWSASQICRIFTIESARSRSDAEARARAAASNGNNRVAKKRCRARLRLNPLLIPGVLMSAITACCYARYMGVCANCRGDGDGGSTITSTITSTCMNTPPLSSTPPSLEEEIPVNLFEAGEHDPVLEKWKTTGEGVPHWGTGDNRTTVCKCKLQNVAAWFREAFAEDERAEMEFVIFLAELSRESQ
ncbi:hypothetical protein F5Y04DRAFT_264867 [Hypomontagnella monticulosa]|nr:hypothetical protein F5Y04DRAFT_264867 [Hypomontagnella monticulosa]